MDPRFADAIRDLLSGLASGAEVPLPAGGGLARLLREAHPSSSRLAVAALTERWFPAPPAQWPNTLLPGEPRLNGPRVAEAEKHAAVLREHVVRRRRWQALSSNESTFYRFRRSAYAAFAERAWAEVARRPFPTNRPCPDFARFVGRQREVAALLALLGEPAPGGAVVGVEGPGGTGKTALLHAVAHACEEAARDWRPTAVPPFDALVWASGAGGLDLARVLDVAARTLDYPGLLARDLPDRREAVRDLLARRAVLLVVDDVDASGDTALWALLRSLPAPSRALLSARRRLPPDVRAVVPEPLAPGEVQALLMAEAERQGVPAAGRALVAVETGPLASAARYPLLAGWAVGQLRCGQTVERVAERLARAEGEVFEAMFSASLAGLSADARALLAALPLLPASVDRATLLAAGGPAARAALDALLETSLLEVGGEGFSDAERRYGLHPVTRSFVQAHLPLEPSTEAALVARLLDAYARLAETHGGPARNWRDFGRLEEALPNVLAVVERAAVMAVGPGPEARAALDRALLALADGLRNVFLFGRAWAEGLSLFEHARQAARRLGDPVGEGWNAYRLGVLQYERGTAGPEAAQARASEAADLLQRGGDPRGRGHALRLLGRASLTRGDATAAERLLAEAERLLAAHGHGDDVAIVRASRADLLRQTGRLAEAANLYRAVLAAGLEDPATEANVRHDLGTIALGGGDVAAAGAAFQAAAALAEAAGARAILARCRLGLARVARAQSDRTEVRQQAAAAVDLFERLGDAEQAAEARALLE